MHKFTKIIAVFAILLSIFCFSTPKSKQALALNETEISVQAKASYLIDHASGTEILSNNADAKLPIASMTKLATLAVVFNEIEEGRLSLDDKVSVSQNAADTEGSSAFLDAGSSYSVQDLIKTIVMVSANDSCVALAEKIAGSEELFAKKMNNLCSKLKLSNTHFENCTGLPSASHYSSARDIAKIYSQICDNSLYKQYSKIWMEDFIHPSGRKTGLVNTNRLIKTYSGCESGKTGHTSEAKYCLTASASRSGMRLIAVIIGAESSKVRFAEVTKMFNYGFANYQTQTIINTSLPLAKVSVRGATQRQLELYAKRDYSVLQKKGEEKDYSTKLEIPNSITASIENGQVIGKIYVLDQNKIVVDEIELVSKENINKIKLGEIFHNIALSW
ncbi:MAG: D-alanyl-D-alanine carboxypeptidase [Clostridia bacterium]|nr:D-alanyl-D-alanine carboxypeptidase [Clostridia bacterium]